MGVSGSGAKPHFRLAVAPCLAAASLLLIGVVLSEAQELRKLDRDRGQAMLQAVKSELQKHYYDPAFHGLDLEERFARAGRDIEGAASLSHMHGIIAQAVLDLDDSHTFFVPPELTVKYDYGWRLRIIGDVPYVIAVKPRSDAAAKGLKAGDAVLSVDGRPLNRRVLWIFKQLYYRLRPVPAMRLVVQSPGGQPRQLDIATRIDRGKRRLDITQGEDIWDILRRYEDLSEDYRSAESPDKKIFIWNIPSFTGDEKPLDAIAARLNKYQSVVLDLRGNPGGYMTRLQSLLGFFFDHDVTVCRLRGREGEPETVVAKARGEKAFPGKIVVVVVSESASAAEIFARVIQLENRGLVVGDLTAGAVQQARYFPKQMGGESVIFYGVSVADAEVLMKDGRSLEGIGVVPDMAAKPTAADLAAGRDPVLARAVFLAGGLIQPAEAGKLFPYTWKD
jgi:carboxyl-terminal processing protease